MRLLITGSCGHLGEALMRSCLESGVQAQGLDIKPSPFTHHVGSICNPEFVQSCVSGVDAVIHTATLHKPHVATHSRQDFVDVNITGTLNLLEASASNHLRVFVYTSTTSTFGDAMQPQANAGAVWVTENLQPVPKNIYGVSKVSAENLCQLFARNYKLPCVVLRTSRFFPEDDDNPGRRCAYSDANLKVNELLHRRVDIEDVVRSHMLALELGSHHPFERFIISATPPFQQTDCARLVEDAPAVLAKYLPEYTSIYRQLGWCMFPQIDRVYDNAHARDYLGWEPRYTFEHAIKCLSEGRDYRSDLTLAVGSKGYHEEVFEDGPFPTEEQ